MRIAMLGLDNYFSFSVALSVAVKCLIVRELAVDCPLGTVARVIACFKFFYESFHRVVRFRPSSLLAIGRMYICF